MQREKKNMARAMIGIVLLVIATVVFLRKYWITNLEIPKVWAIATSSIDEVTDSQNYKEVLTQDSNPIIITIDDDPVLWDPYAPVTIIEFSDYECPFCKKHFTQTYPQLKSDYIDKGLVKMVYRDFPLSFHDPLSTQESMAADCVREQWWDKVYFQYHDLIFQTTKSNGRWMEKSKLYELAQDVWVNAGKFKECLDSEKYKDEVQKDIADGQKYGVSWTPWFFINGRELKWAVPFSSFKQIIDEELAKSK